MLLSGFPFFLAIRSIRLVDIQLILRGKTRILQPMAIEIPRAEDNCHRSEKKQSQFAICETLTEDLEKILWQEQYGDQGKERQQIDKTAVFVRHTQKQEEG